LKAKIIIWLLKLFVMFVYWPVTKHTTKLLLKAIHFLPEYYK